VVAVEEDEVERLVGVRKKMARVAGDEARLDFPVQRVDHLPRRLCQPCAPPNRLRAVVDLLHIHADEAGERRGGDQRGREMNRGRTHMGANFQHARGAKAARKIEQRPAVSGVDGAGAAIADLAHLREFRRPRLPLLRNGRRIEHGFQLIARN
jgi:nucleoside phosphorylase